MTTHQTAPQSSTSALPPTAPAPQAPLATEWVLDPAHTQVGFRVRHMMVSWTRGRFDTFEGKVRYEEGRPDSLEIDVKVDTASIETQAPDRDKHLRSADFFDAEAHPTMHFASKGAKATGADSLEVQGSLTIRGITRPVTLEVSDITPPGKDPWGNTVRGASAKARISRKDFGLSWNTALETGGVLVGDEVQIQLEIELKAQG